MSAAASLLDPGQGLTERLVRLPDGRRLRLVEGGARNPLVVFEAGLGASASSWLSVQRAVAAHARTVSYDRAGYGGSDPDTEPRTLSRMADDLAALIDACNEPQPVVLVGHSLGGPILRAFAAAHPDRVAGLCLIDATVSEVMNPVAPKAVAVMASALRLLRKVGLADVVTKALLPKLSEELSPADRTVMLRDVAAAGWSEGFRREAGQLGRIREELVLLQQAGLPDVPTVSLLGERAQRGGAEQRRVLNQVVTHEMSRGVDSEALVIRGAGHLMPQQQPAATAEAIVSLVSRATRTRNGELA